MKNKNKSNKITESFLSELKKIQQISSNPKGYMSNKSQGEVVGTVLIILIVVVSAGIIMSFVIPFINKQLEGGKCVEVTDAVKIQNNDQYTCWNTSLTSNLLFVQIHFGDSSDKISGFAIELGGASSKTYKIFNSSSDPAITMFNGNNILELPNKNEERTYVFNIPAKPDSVTVYPILSNGKFCDKSDTLTTINQCLLLS